MDWFDKKRLDAYLKKLNPVYHNEGRSIIMPSGSGKSYWMENVQPVKNEFIDSDPLCWAVGAMPALEGPDYSGLNWDDNFDEICQRVDKVVVMCKAMGLWIMGATWWLPVNIDAIVILPKEKHKEYLAGKKHAFYPGYYEEEVVDIIKLLRKTASDREPEIPIFSSIDKCVAWVIRTQRIHTMSITKAAIGLMYHKHMRRNIELVNGITVGSALNMMSGYADNQWSYEDYRKQVEMDTNLLYYSRHRLAQSTKTRTWRYNNLIYQLLASAMRDVADKFGAFMEDPAGKLKKDGDHYYKHGKAWKWEHTKSGEPLGPHGLWMTKDFAKLFGEKAKEHVLDMSKSERTDIAQKEWGGIGAGKLKRYWNGWFFTDKNAYAIGFVAQAIALTPDGVKTQIYEENWDDDLTKHPEDLKWQFINSVEVRLKV